MKKRGISIIEILIAITLTGLLAVLTIPKILPDQNSARKTTISRTEQLMEQVAASVQLQAANRGSAPSDSDPIDFTATSLDAILQNYGTYFIFKTVNPGPPAVNYFLMSDGSRITTTPQLFSTGALADYPANLVTNQTWGVNGFCGSFPQNQCIYLDINGATLPNMPGRNGDLVPVRVNPATGEVKTLYQWAAENGMANQCKYVSSYDVYAGVNGATACP